MTNPVKHHLRLKKPCGNCPFRVEGAIDLAPGRLEGIIAGLVEDDLSTFQCHATVHCEKGGEWTEDGYQPSGHEAMCAGAAAYLWKIGRPTVAMRIGLAIGACSTEDWARNEAVIINPENSSTLQG